MTILLTNPDYDETTGYLFYYNKELIKLAEEKGIKLINLKKPNLTKSNFEGQIIDKNPTLLLINGHGNEKIIYGDKIKGKEEPIIEDGKNHGLLRDKLVYARSCWTAVSLGKRFLNERGCFIGYIVPFQFWVDERMSIPAKDKTAELFFRPSNLLAKSLINGNSAMESVRKFREETKNNIMDLLKNRNEPGAMSLIMILWSNMEGQRIFGDVNMCYSPQ